MKKIILSMFVLSAVIAVQAQDTRESKGEKPGMERKRHHKGMDMKQLNLTEEQKAKFKSQNESFRKQMEELKKNENITVKEWKSKSETLRKEHKANMGSILTSDQKAQLEKIKAEGRAKQEGRMKERGERMKTQLGLTEEQSAKMQSQRKLSGEKMKAIRENKSLTDEQKKEQMKDLYKEQKAGMESILTEEQLKKLKETRHKKTGGDRKHPGTNKSI